MSEFEEDEFNKTQVHEACWDLTMRGGVGETPLHVCLLNDTEVHLEVAKIMLKLYPKLALDYYEAEEYYGKRPFCYCLCFYFTLCLTSLYLNFTVELSTRGHLFFITLLLSFDELIFL